MSPRASYRMDVPPTPHHGGVQETSQLSGWATSNSSGTAAALWAPQSFSIIINNIQVRSWHNVMKLKLNTNSRIYSIWYMLCSEQPSPYFSNIMKWNLALEAKINPFYDTFYEMSTSDLQLKWSHGGFAEYGRFCKCESKVIHVTINSILRQAFTALFKKKKCSKMREKTDGHLAVSYKTTLLKKQIMTSTVKWYVPIFNTLNNFKLFLRFR